jgi:hypothetical protein
MFMGKVLLDVDVCGTFQSANDIVTHRVVLVYRGRPLLS